jgi:type I restriction enzyme S subunit
MTQPTDTMPGFHFPDGWTLRTIEECASGEKYSTQIGPFGKALMANEYTPTGVPVLRGVNVNQGRFHDDDFAYIEDETADRLAKYESFPDDVLLCHKGTLGKIGLMPRARKHDRYIMGNSMLRVRCDRKKLIPEYLYYWLCSGHGQHYLFSRVSQVGVPQIQRPLTTLREAALPVPPLPEQKAIAGVLGALDDKIELNRRMNETLEGIARAIFKSWFIDFDPTHAKANGQTPPGLDPATAALFPDRFQPSPLGPIPEGWKVKKLDEVCEFAYGKALKAANRIPGPVSVYGSNGPVGSHNEHLVEGPGIVVGRKGNPGTVTWSQSNFFPIDTTFYVALKNGAPSLHYLRHALDSLNLPSLSADSAVPGLNRNMAYMSDLLVPAEEEVAAFTERAKALMARVEHNVNESQTLAGLRDTLLPKLLSGEVRLPKAIPQIERSST